MSVLDELESYHPYNQQEKEDLFLLKGYLKENHIFERKHKDKHVTVSCWILNKTHDKVLMCFHNIYQSYSWLGGHADGNEHLLEVAIKEAKEESGLKDIVPLSTSIFSIEILTVNGHFKNDQYVSSHLHLNFTYLLEADEKETLHIKEDENSDLKWFSFDEVLKVSNEPWLVENIYKKLINKLSEGIV